MINQPFDVVVVDKREQSLKTFASSRLSLSRNVVRQAFFWGEAFLAKALRKRNSRAQYSKKHLLTQTIISIH